jgi:signal transduction protein with GAF and PtsI domain
VNVHRDGAVRLAILDEFLEERVPSVDSVARRLGDEAAAVRESFERLASGRAIVLKPGTHDIRMAAPFAAERTDFVVRVGERSYHANCIWDALGIPAMLQATDQFGDADIETTCLDCSTPLSLAVRGGRVTSDPADVVAHFGVPAARWWADIVFT